MSHFYEVERREFHAERPGFRINELQISPTQQVLMLQGLGEYDFVPLVKQRP